MALISAPARLSSFSPKSSKRGELVLTGIDIRRVRKKSFVVSCFHCGEYPPEAQAGPGSTGNCSYVCATRCPVMGSVFLIWSAFTAVYCGAANLYAQPSILESSGSLVTVSYTGYSGNGWINIYIENFTNPIGYVFLNSTSSVSFEWPLVNVRLPYVFRLFDSSAQLIASSNSVDFLLGPSEPTQAHLSLGSQPDQMNLMWVSGVTDNAFVNYGTDPSNLNYTVTAKASTYAISSMCNSPANSTQDFLPPGTLWTAVLTDLVPGTRYFYVYGSADAASSVGSFLSSPGVGANLSVRAYLYGDMGVSPAWAPVFEPQPPSLQVSTWIQKLAAQHSEENQLLLHIGDISYARGHAVIWEWFFDLIQPVARQLPYMVGIGNHEYDYPQQPWKPTWATYGDDSGGECGVPYFKRFMMPPAPKTFASPDPNLWYSYSHGPVHWVVMSTEHCFLPHCIQYQFLEADLAAVDRSATPWVIFSGHRPMYSSEEYSMTNGINEHLRATIEPLLVKYSVDLCLWGHVHAYERTCGQVNLHCAGSDEAAPVHLVIGAAGNLDQAWWETIPTQQGWQAQYHHYQPVPRLSSQPWSIFRTYEFGFVQMTANETVLQTQFIDAQRGQVHDELLLTKARK